MTLTEFLNKWNGKYCEVTGSAGAENQCVDLANEYLRSVLYYPIIGGTNAIDFPTRMTDKFDYILNTPDGVPGEGDLVIWGGTAYGHIAIFIEGNASTFKSFDQNYPTGSPCHVQGHTYSNVIGWLRYKGGILTEIETLKAQLAEEIRKKNETYQELTEWKDKFLKVCNKLDKPADIDVVLADIDTLLKMEDIANQRQKDLEIKTQEIVDLSAKMEQLNQDKAALEKKLDNASKELLDLGMSITQATQQIEDLKKVRPTTEMSALQLIVMGIAKIFVRK